MRDRSMRSGTELAKRVVDTIAGVVVWPSISVFCISWVGALIRAV